MFILFQFLYVQKFIGSHYFCTHELHSVVHRELKSANGYWLRWKNKVTLFPNPELLVWRKSGHEEWILKDNTTSKKLRSFGWRCDGAVWRVKSNVACCYSDRISHTCNSHSKLAAKIFKMPCIGSLASTSQAGESIRKQLRMLKDVSGSQVRKWSCGSKGRTAAS